MIETENKKLVILDSPGHKNYVPSMIEATCQADCAVILVSAKPGEFESSLSGK